MLIKAALDNPTPTIIHLQFGTVFRHGGDVYLRVRMPYHQAVKLLTGELYSFAETTKPDAVYPDAECHLGKPS